MKILQIGAGSMGNRRMRDLSARDDTEIILFDAWDERRNKAVERFGIKAFDSLDDALAWGPDTMIVSAGPNAHREFISLALKEGLNCFCEASIFGYDHREVEKVSKEKNIVVVPSQTLFFYPITEVVKKIISEDLGSLLNYSALQYFYVPDWHPGETSDFYYALNRGTAAGREINPWNLAFLNYVFGCTPIEVMGTVTKRGDIGVDSEDTWCMQTRLSNGATGQTVVSMACKEPKTLFMAAGENGVIEFDLVGGSIRRMLPGKGIDDTVSVGSLYDVLEEVYANEINRFADTILGKAEWPFSYETLAHATATLAAAEKSALFNTVEKVNLDILPAILPDAY